VVEPTPGAVALAGNTDPGPYFRGQPEAPITIDEYADFQ
jgi:hypothetical protein